MPCPSGSSRPNVIRLTALLLVLITVYMLVFQRNLLRGLLKNDIFTYDVGQVIFNGKGNATSEFPRIYKVRTCDSKLNKSVPAAVCRLLAASIDDEERRTYLRMLTYFNNLAKTHKWTYFMYFGTLLGSWRHHGFIPYDQDVDLYIDYKHRKDMINVIEKQTRFVPKQMVTDSIKMYDSKHIVGGAYYPDVGRWWAPDIDTFFYKQNTTHIFRSDNPREFVIKKTDVFPLHLRPFEHLQLPAPKNTLLNLVSCYGNAAICKRYSSGYKPVDCRELRKYVPFVHRVFRNGEMEERLLLNQKVIHVKMVKEPKSSVTKNAYTLERL